MSSPGTFASNTEGGAGGAGVGVIFGNEQFSLGRGGNGRKDSDTTPGASAAANTGDGGEGGAADANALSTGGNGGSGLILMSF